MRKSIVLLLILKIAFSSEAAVSFKQRLKRNSQIESNHSSVAAAETFTLDILVFQQPLDHFNYSDNRTWNQRYAVTVTYYRKSGPIFLYINGANPMNRGNEFSYSMLAYAQKLNAICFALEHRFYGRIRPVNGSIINHLGSAQALADIANFIKGATKEFHLSKHVNWIVFGCSYAGALAAWSRLKYPHLILGAVASSAPLLAQVDYYEFEQIVEESLKSYDSKCVESITVAFQEIAHLDVSPQNIKNITRMFYLHDPEPFEYIPLIKASVIYIMMKIIRKAVQYNDINPISIPIVCRIMTEYNGTKLEALAEIRKMDMEHEDDNVKIPSEKIQEGRNSAKDEEWDSKKTWTYQRCSEFGHFSSFTNTTFLSPVKHLLIPIEIEIKFTCAPFFGPHVKNLTEKIMHTNLQYGGLQFNARNTLFIHGSLDPWYKAGLYKQSNSSLYESIFITGTSHCADLLRPTDKDIPELTNARNKVLRTLKSWLKENSTSISSRN